MLIYNLGGLALGLSGVFTAITISYLTGARALGLFALAGLWVAFGRPRAPLPDGTREPAPALFFIPLAFLAVPVFVVGIASAVQQIREASDDVSEAAHPVATLVKPEKVEVASASARERLRADERALVAEKFSGDVVLSKKAFAAFQSVVNPAAKPHEANVFTRVAGDKVLVLIRLESLRTSHTEGRAELLDVLATSIASLPEVKDKQVYIGLRGLLLYGGIHTPTISEEGKAVAPDALLAVYDGAANGKNTATANSVK
jgi:hypothetical protein